MKYLLLTDIHANIDAIEAIQEACDSILILGDLVDYGAAPEETVEWVMKNASTVISGNHDSAMATGADCKSSPVSYELSVATREYFKPRLSSGVLEFLGRLPHEVKVERRGVPIHLVHATPRDPLYEYLSGEAEDEVWRSAVGDLAGEEGWLFLGHTHRPFIRKIGRLTIVNPGSLGMPVDGDPRASYAVWDDGKVELKRVRYDVERAVERIFDSGLPKSVAEPMSAVLRYAGRGGNTPA